jgi:hypothetical protein
MPGRLRTAPTPAHFPTSAVEERTLAALAAIGYSVVRKRSTVRAKASAEASGV